MYGSFDSMTTTSVRSLMMVFGPWRKPSVESATATIAAVGQLEQLQRRLAREAAQLVAAEIDDALEARARPAAAPSGRRLAAGRSPRTATAARRPRAAIAPKASAAGEQHRAEARCHREAAVVGRIRQQRSRRHSASPARAAASAPSALQVIDQVMHAGRSSCSARSSAATLSGLLPERANETSSVGTPPAAAGAGRSRARWSRSHRRGDAGARDSAGARHSPMNAEVPAPVSTMRSVGSASSGARNASSRARSRGQQRCDLRPHGGLLRDLARRPRRAARLERRRPAGRERSAGVMTPLQASPPQARNVGPQRRAMPSRSSASARAASCPARTASY